MTGVVAINHDPNFHPAVKCPDVYRAIRQHQEGAFHIVYNKACARWQIVKLLDGTLSLVRVWQDEGGNYLPPSMKMYDWLVSTEFETVFGTRDPRKIGRALTSIDQAEKLAREVTLMRELEAYKRDEAHLIARRGHEIFTK